MKTYRLTFLFLFMAFSSLMNAEYVPFVYEGRTWEVATAYNARYDTHPLQYKYTYSRYFFEGDTVINGHHCLEMYQEEAGNKQFAGFFYEEDKKVYYFLSTEYPDGELVYDFSLSKGDTLRTWYTILDVLHEYEVIDVREAEIYGNRVRAQFLGDYFAYEHTVLEGIGTPQGPLGIEKWGLSGNTAYFLTQCSVDGNVVYTRDVEPSTKTCLSETPYCFLTGICLENTDIWVSFGWRRAPFSDDLDRFSPFNQQVDSIVGNRVYMSHHYHSTTDFKYSYYYSGSLFSRIGTLPKGDYTIELSLVDDDGELTVPPYEIPFTVLPNEEGLMKGFVLANNGEEEKEKHSREESEPIDLTFTPEGDSLHVTGWLTYTCCTDHYCYYEISNDSIRLLTIETRGDLECDCYSLFSVDFKIGPFTGDKCVVVVDEYYSEEPSTLVFDFTSVAPVEADSPTEPESVYDLQGRPSNNPQKGIVVKSGKKVLLK
ncbi:MAG: hypothetical protein IK000_07690 [Bacteroidaceae bacterium]|nr:hypothetical protein [Bacteroidaceae bacterium]